MRIKNDQTGEIREWDGNTYVPVQQAQDPNQNLSGTLNVLGMDTGISIPQGVEAGLVGAGKTMSDIGSGAERLYRNAIGDQQGLDQLQAEQTANQQAYDPLSQANPWSTGIGEALPYLATMPLSGGLATQAGISAAGEGMRYGEEQGMQAGIGAAMAGAGYGLGRMASRVYGTVRGTSKANQLAPEAQRLAERAEEVGMRLTPGQQTGSLPLQQMEASAKSMPFTSGLFEPYMDANQKTINKLAAESIGETGEEITGDTFARAADRIGAVYQDVAQNVKNVPLDEGKLLDLMENSSVDTQRYIDNYFKRYPNLDTGNLSGKEWTDLRNLVAKDTRNAWKNTPGSAEDLQDFQGILLEGLEATEAGSTGALKEAGKQWRNLTALEAGQSVTKGNVNPRSLATQLKRKDKGGFGRSRNKSDYYDAVRAANQFSDVVGNSGTATRGWLEALATDPGAALASTAIVRPTTAAYMRTGGHPAISGLLGAVPSGGSGQIGASATRPMAAEFEELR